jgi:UDP-4-amino-4,6-dideoxy-N-acetyl-beta-L-altrosamine transaminase
MPVIPYGRQDINDADIQAVVDVLQSDWLTQGPAVERFESALVNYTGAAYAVAVNSATSALHIACRVAGLGPGDWLWTSPNTFVASANCALYCGAKVDFVDIDPNTYNMSTSALAAKLEKAEREGLLPRVVIPVHFAGQPCDMAAIYNLASRYGFLVIEDASHAVGGRYLDTKLGSCRYSDMTVFSFHPVKIITTGEGGMVLTNRDHFAEKLRLLRSHGITKDAARIGDAYEGPWYYEQIALGYNYRMPDILAGLGLSQMERLDEFVTRRHAIAQAYDKALSGTPLVIPWQAPDRYSACHLYVVRVPADKRRHVFEHMRGAGILVNVHYIPVHLQPYYLQMGFTRGQFPEAERYYQEALSLPMYYGLTNDEQAFVVETLKAALR